ncbi:MAG: TetR/AcrR family transcriptional regulator [Oscillibacter sp.]|nr:TetR/AcrR family transcriptional regulator [Oscillibacter sp.]
MVTSREAILKSCRQVVAEKGLTALNMRSVAEAGHIALGSLYNYFPSKDELVMAAIESVWGDIFQMDRACRADLPFPEYVRWIFESVRRGAGEYPNFFTAHSISVASAGRSRAREKMERCFDHMKLGMAEALEADGAVRGDAFRAGFSKEDLIEFVFWNILTLLVQKKDDCEILLEMIRRTLYTG